MPDPQPIDAPRPNHSTGSSTKNLYRSAIAQGKPYQRVAFFVAPQVGESVFSNSEIVRELGREKLKSDAHEYHRPTATGQPPPANRRVLSSREPS